MKSAKSPFLSTLSRQKSVKKIYKKIFDFTDSYGISRIQYSNTYNSQIYSSEILLFREFLIVTRKKSVFQKYFSKWTPKIYLVQCVLFLNVLFLSWSKPLYKYNRSVRKWLLFLKFQGSISHRSVRRQKGRLQIIDIK